MIKPSRLYPGDKVATVSLSWGGPGAIPGRYDAGVRQLEETFGLKVVEMPHTRAEDAWLQRNPKARAEDLMQAFADPAIKGIFSTIGGDDSIRILPYLDLAVIKANPKVFIGFSDTTITHLACYRAGLVSFYGPSMMAGFAENCGIFPYTRQSVLQTLFSADPIGRIGPAPEGWTDEFLTWGDPANQSRRRKLNPSLEWKLVQGKGRRRGALIGGCIEVFDWLRGTDFWPGSEAWQDAILFLETSEDAPTPQQVGWMLRPLAALGVLHRLSGILFGRPGGQTPPEKFADYEAAILRVVAEEEGLVDLPILARLDFGHTDPKFILPYGVQAEIDCDRSYLTILEGAVI
jgi:muramoyltetrapeptide carboxypeptidase LdcA involved in peptidoglycan recycling